MGEQKWLSPCTKPAFEAEILVPTIVKLSNRCQSDQNHLVPPNIAGAKKILVPKNIGAGAKNLNLPTPQDPRPQITNLPVAAKKCLKRTLFDLLSTKNLPLLMTLQQL